MKTKKPDQSEVLTENAQLELHCANLRAQLAANGHTVAAPQLSADILQRNEQLAAHFVELEGIASGKVAVPAASAKIDAGKGQTLTDKVLAAKSGQAATPAASATSAKTLTQRCIEAKAQAAAETATH